MSKVPFKSQAISRDLAVRLKNRIAGLEITEDLDSDRFPTLKCTVAAESVFIRISTDFERSEDDGHVDALGLAQTVYAPHKAELLQEEESTTPLTATYLELQAKALFELSKLGTKLIIKSGAGVKDDTNFADAETAATTIVAEIRSNDINPLTQQM